MWTGLRASGSLLRSPVSIAALFVLKKPDIFPARLHSNFQKEVRRKDWKVTKVPGTDLVFASERSPKGVHRRLSSVSFSIWCPNTGESCTANVWELV